LAERKSKNTAEGEPMEVLSADHLHVGKRTFSPAKQWDLTINIKLNHRDNGFSEMRKSIFTEK
jgi:hypothetical protein